MSKANQKFVQADEAVSPVIGVILMVAITVVLAAVVFVLVSNLGEGSEAAPNVTFNKNSADGILTVVSAETADWGDFTIIGCAVLDSGDSTEALSTGAAVTPSDNADDPVSAGNTLTGCEGTVRMTHIATNTLVYSTTF